MALTKVKGSVFIAEDVGIYRAAYDYTLPVDGTTDAAAAINEAIDKTPGYGAKILLPSTMEMGTNRVLSLASKIILKNGIILEGAGPNNTVLKAANGLDDNVIESLNFSTLTGTNKWLTTDGVVHGCGLRDLQINGNKNNQLAGRGIALYAKRYMIDNIIIRDAYGDGFYSEAGDVGGQNSWEDMPESSIGTIWIYTSNGNGFVYNGPHDGLIRRILVSQAGAIGAKISRSAGVYNGVADFGFIHAYASVSDNIRVDCRIKADHLIGEAGYAHGINLTSTCIDSQIAKIEDYGNDRNNTSSYWATLISGSSNLIGQIANWSQNVSKGGTFIEGDDNKIGLVHIDGVQSAGSNLVGLDINGEGNQIGGGYINGYDNPGCIGLRTGTSGAKSYNNIAVHLRNNTTQWNNVTAGNHNTYDIKLETLAGQTPFSGVGPNSNNTEKWKVSGVDGSGALTYSHFKGVATGFAVDSIGLKTVVLPHNCVVLPQIEDVQITPHISTAVNDYAYNYCRVNGITATNVTIAVYVSTASGTGGATMNVGVEIKI